MLNHLHLFIDGSVDLKSKKGCGAYLIIHDLDTLPKTLDQHIQTTVFKHTSSSKLELQNFLSALKTIDFKGNKIFVYTDSQLITNLPGRRKRLEANNYYSNKNIRLNHYTLYQEFYRMTDRYNCCFIKIKGHQPSFQKDQIDKIFSSVDRAARKQLKRLLLDDLIT